MTPVQKNIYAFGAALALIAGSFGGGVYLSLLASPMPQGAAVAEAFIPTVALDQNKLEAKAAALYDVKSGRLLYQKNANEQLPLASLTKLMAAEVVLSQKSPDTPVQISLSDVRATGDSGLKVGDTITLGDLIKFSLVASSNDAMSAAAASLGSDPIAAMNVAAYALGLTKTHFFNVTGLDVTTTTSGAYGSAYDVARLAAAFYRNHPGYFELTTRPDVQIDQSGKELSAAATMAPLRSIPGFVAAKTGYTDLAGGNLVAVFDLEPGLTVVAAVLGSTHEGRFSDIKTLIEAAQQSL